VAAFTHALHGGEVLGVAGRLGLGPTDMARLTLWVEPSDGGDVTAGGMPVTIRNPAAGGGGGGGVRYLPKGPQTGRHLWQIFYARDHHHRVAGQTRLFGRNPCHRQFAAGQPCGQIRGGHLDPSAAIALGQPVDRSQNTPTPVSAERKPRRTARSLMR